jgi:hypothetical protein
MSSASAIMVRVAWDGISAANRSLSKNRQHATVRRLLTIVKAKGMYDAGISSVISDAKIRWIKSRCPLAEAKGNSRRMKASRNRIKPSSP